MANSKVKEDNTMPSNQTARVYILAVIAIGAAIVVASAANWNGEPLRFFCYAVLALLSSTLKVRLPGIAGTFSANSVFTLVAISQLSLPEAVLLSVGCAVVQSLWHVAKAPKPTQVFFNAGVFAISSAVTFYAYQFFLRWTTADAWVAAFVAASCVFFLVNTFAVSTVISLVENMPCWRIWRVWHLWSFPYYLVSVALAAVLMSSGSAVAWKLVVATVPLICAAFLCYRLLVQRFASAEV
jgi:hypothetical protein